ncbi:hypothetical protein Tco_0529541 [Tanacetum coccineum]
MVITVHDPVLHLHGPRWFCDSSAEDEVIVKAFEMELKFPTIALELHPMNAIIAMRPRGIKKEITKEKRVQIQPSYSVAKKCHRPSILNGKGMVSFAFFCEPLITNDFGDGDPTRDIIVNTKDGQPKRILELHTSYMALQYPLLFPYGEDGYHDKIPYHRNTGTRKTNRDYVTMKEYYHYKNPDDYPR